MKNDKWQFVIRTSDFYLSLFICHISLRALLLAAHGAPAWAAVVVNSASVERNSRSLGGLLSTRFTCGGISFSATSRWPQPVSRITGVAGAALLIDAATLRPST